MPEDRVNLRDKSVTRDATAERIAQEIKRLEGVEPKIEERSGLMSGWRTEVSGGGIKATIYSQTGCATDQEAVSVKLESSDDKSIQRKIIAEDLKNPES